jgi:hypothetical protein
VPWHRNPSRYQTQLSNLRVALFVIRTVGARSSVSGLVLEPREDREDSAVRSALGI